MKVVNSSPDDGKRHKATSRDSVGGLREEPGERTEN